MSKIIKVKARQVFDSRGNPTVEAEVYTSTLSASAICPSGASTGTYEAYEKRDKSNKKYLGKSVLVPVQFINSVISKKLKNLNIHDQERIDHVLIKLDGTKQKKKIGANAILSISMAAKKLSAKIKKIPLYKNFLIKNNYKLPFPMMNIINGGSHANNSVDIQEFMIMPIGVSSFSEAIRCGVEVFHALGKILDSKKYITTVGDEGGYAPNLSSNKEALDVILEAIEKAGYKPELDVVIALDVASSEFYKDGFYELSSENKKYTNKEFIELLKSWKNDYPIVSVEDGLDENDWEGWHDLTIELGSKLQLVGDDLFVTNPKIFKEGIEKKIANAILIKLNQIGTLTETLDAINMANRNNYNTIVSHRSGETEDTFISDLSVAYSCGQIKTGSLSRSDRVAKYNQLLRIEEELGNNAIYEGVSVFDKIKG